MSIRRLPNDVIEKITSSSSIVSLNGVVCELVKNSLDAGASKVSIVIDYVRGNCTVEDNGEGIPAEEFRTDGNLAKPNSTSRFPQSSSYHGRHGNFLASLAALSLVTISSKAGEEGLNSSLAIHRGAAASREATGPSAQHRISYTHGTRVAIFDLFGSMPVRVKHRASVFCTPSNLEKEFKALIYDLTALLLAWPSSVSVSLREALQNCQLRMKSLDGLAKYQQTSRLLMQAGLSDSDEANSWIPVTAVNGGISVDGCISTVPVATRNSQFISLGIQPMEKSLGGNILFEEVNEIFTSSSFGVIEEDAGQEEMFADSALPAYWKPRKGLERWPMFYLRFESDDALVEDLFRPQSSTLAAIISLLRAVCYAFLRKHKMRPRKRMHTRQIASSSKGVLRLSPFQDGQSSSKTPSTSEGPLSRLDNRHRIKVGHRADMASAQAKTASKYIVGPGGQLLRKPFMEEDRGESFAEGLCSGADNHHLRSSETRTFETLDTHCPEGKGQWMEKLLQSWKNPVFETAEPKVHRLPADSEFGFSGGNRHSASSNISGQLSKNSLAEADIIAQVDNKFILVKLPLVSPVGGVTSNTSSAQFALFAVDQHAADERCRLEALMACYFEQKDGGLRPVVEPLDRHLSFDISRKEAGMFAKRMAFWGGWGIRYCVADTELSKAPKEPPAARVTVTGLPPSILERCRGEPRLLLDLLRKEMWSAEDNLGSECAKAHPNSNFQGCPRGILELLHSRACRSAVMFNDELTLSECTSLIRRLAQCSLPFQCAHGRPSMAPLVDLGNKTDGVLCTLPTTAFRDHSSMPVMPSLEAWARWMDG